MEASIEQNGLAVTLKTESDFQVRQLEELFAKACLKQNISAAGADKPEEPEHSGKTFSLTGWKIGYITACAKLMEPIKKAHQFLVFTVSPALQHGVAFGLVYVPASP